MSQNLNYFECWISVAGSLLSQALIGEPSLVESLPKPLPPGSFGFVAMVEGEEQGRFAVMLDGGLTDAPLLGEGADQKSGWSELLKEVAEGAAGELLAKTGRKCKITSFTAIDAERRMTRAFQLKAGDRAWTILVNDEVVPLVSAASSTKGSETSGSGRTAERSPTFGRSESSMQPGLTPGLELLLDVELEASLRFGAREMPLGEILDLGPGDVVQLDRHVSDAVDLIVGDKIVARGDVVLVNGNFGLRVTEVAEPQRRLESIRCLF